MIRIRMVAMLAVPALVAAAPSTSDRVADFRVGGVSFMLPLPAGYCLPSGRVADVMQLLAAGDTENVTDLSLAQCDGKMLSGASDYTIIKTPRRGLLVAIDRAELLEAVGKEFDSKLDITPMFDAAGKSMSDLTGRKIDVGGIPFGVTAEQRQPHNSEREPHHLACNIKRFSVRPASLRAIGAGHHRLRVGGEALPAERWLNKPPLTQMQRTFAGQQTFPQQRLRALEHSALRKVPLDADKYFFNQIRPIQKENLLQPEPKVDDITVLLRCSQQKFGGIRTKLRQHAEQRPADRSRRIPER